jgi:hypothetical protein
MASPPPNRLRRSSRRLVRDLQRVDAAQLARRLDVAEVARRQGLADEAERKLRDAERDLEGATERATTAARHRDDTLATLASARTAWREQVAAWDTELAGHATTTWCVTPRVEGPTTTPCRCRTNGPELSPIDAHAPVQSNLLRCCDIAS